MSKNEYFQFYIISLFQEHKVSQTWNITYTLQNIPKVTLILGKYMQKYILLIAAGASVNLFLESR